MGDAKRVKDQMEGDAEVATTADFLMKDSNETRNGIESNYRKKRSRKADKKSSQEKQSRLYDVETRNGNYRKMWPTTEESG